MSLDEKLDRLIDRLTEIGAAMTRHGNAASLYSVSPMRWSVTRFCGKLYVRMRSDRSPVPIWPLRVAARSASLASRSRW